MQPLKDIVVVAEACGLALEPRGDQYAAICPNHDDVNPSLFVHPGKQVWTCMGCNRGGNALSLARFLHQPDVAAIDSDAEPLALPPPDIHPPDRGQLARRFCAFSSLVRAGLAEPRLLRDLDCAVVQEDDATAEVLLSLLEERALTAAGGCGMV